MGISDMQSRRLSQVLRVNQDVLAVYSCVDGQQHHLGDASAEGQR
jgi:hypothetical protein